MATIYAAIEGVELLDSHHGARHLARLRISPASAYTAASDSGSIGGGGTLFGEATTDSLETILASVRRDGKTVNVIGGVGGGAGDSGSAAIFVDTVAESSGNLTFEFANAASTEQNVTSLTIPCEVFVVYDLS